MFKKLSVYLAILALVIGPSLVATSALADSDKGNKNEQKTEQKENRQVKNLFQNWFKSEKDNDNEVENDYDYKNDDRLPSGLRHAPGIEKRVENGKGLPFGWWFKLFGNRPNNGGNSTTTPPTANFSLNNLAINVGTSSAIISWQTNRAANSQLSYSTTSPLTASSSQVTNSNLVFNHSLALTGLTPSTTYYYFVTSTTNSSQTATSSAASFTTNSLPVADIEAPNIVFSTVIGVTTTSARFIWVTNEASNSKVWVSTTTPINLSLTANNQNTSLAYYHDLTVSGLTASTTYNYVLGSTDNAGNTATTSTNTITTD
ncbi:MAG: fibronectin type III domain-containing protein [bacterium]|nr:fibronectin type III domain-containing protein [bacterium]